MIKRLCLFGICMFAMTSALSQDVEVFGQEHVESSVKDAMKVFKEVYVYPEKAKVIEKEILKRLSQGEYKDIQTRDDFVELFTKDLKKISGDGHLSVFKVKDLNDKPTHITSHEEFYLKNNFGIQKVEVLKGNIGYLKLNKFYADLNARKVLDNSLLFLESTDAIIIDLRDCIGGSPELVRYMTSHFTPLYEKLWSIIDKHGKATFEAFAMTYVSTERFRDNFPVVVLTSNDTASGGELFSYTLQSFGRAKIIGESTNGIAHAVGAHPINEFFVGRYATYRPENPITKSSWEGAGVKPDIQVDPEKSLEVAINELSSKNDN